jgi:hypothetical protein
VCAGWQRLHFSVHIKYLRTDLFKSPVPPTGAEFKNEWGYTSTPYTFMGCTAAVSLFLNSFVRLYERSSCDLAVTVEGGGVEF